MGQVHTRDYDRTLIYFRDSEESAPAEYPPEQPEADQLDDDGANYGAEEAEMQAALEKDLEDTEAKIANEKEPNGDSEMGGTEEAQVKEEDSDAGSEDLEAESSDDDEEDEEEEGEGGEDSEMAEGEQKPDQPKANGEKAQYPAEQPEVKVH